MPAPCIRAPRKRGGHFSQASAEAFHVDRLADEPRRAAVLAVEVAEVHALRPGAGDHAHVPRLAVERARAAVALSPWSLRRAERAVLFLTAGLGRVIDVDVAGIAGGTVTVELVVWIALEVLDGRRLVLATWVDRVGQTRVGRMASGAGPRSASADDEHE